MEWLWWVGTALLVGIFEIVSLDFFLIMIAGGALAGGAAAGLGAPFWLQVLVAVFTAVLLLTTMRPLLLRHLRETTPLVETNAAALVGQGAVVVATVSALGGRVKIGGEVWSARAATDGASFAPGDEVRVSRIDGATAVVT